MLAWLVYDAALPAARRRTTRRSRSPSPRFVVLAAWGASQLFAPRAAYIEVGAMLGTIMAANVFFVIIPTHWKLVRAKEAGRSPTRRWNARGKQRSVHNNYLTLPVVFAMLSNHFTFTYGHSHAWLILVALMALGALDPPLLQPPPPRPERLVDPGGAAAGLRRARDRDPAGLDRLVERRRARRRASPRCRRSSRTAARPATRMHPTQPGYTRAAVGIALETAAQIQAARGADQDGRGRLARDAARQRHRA